MIESTPIVLVTALLAGLCVGSFLNVVIHRLPKMLERGWQEQCAELRGEDASRRDPAYNLVVPRSACPACGHRITRAREHPGRVVARAARQVLGLQGADLGPLSGRRAPGRPARRRRDLALRADAPRASPPALFLWTLLALTLHRLRHAAPARRPHAAAAVGGLLANLFGLFVPLASAVIGAIAGYLSLWTIYWLFKLIRGKEGMGYGDFKLLAALGAWLGWQMLPVIVLLSSVVGRAHRHRPDRVPGRDHNDSAAPSGRTSRSPARSRCSSGPPLVGDDWLPLIVRRRTDRRASAAASRRSPTRSRRSASTSPTPTGLRTR